MALRKPEASLKPKYGSLGYKLKFGQKPAAGKSEINVPGSISIAPRKGINPG